VIDTEAVAYDIKEKKLLPFQQLTTRKRKDVRTEDITVRVHIFAFDLLYLNGEVSQLKRASKSQVDRSPVILVVALAEGACGEAQNTSRTLPSSGGRIWICPKLGWFD
jgi:hypothetical protein